MSLARNVIVQTTFTLGSRLLGFVRDLALNARFGGESPLMDAWTKALWLPNLFRRLFAEGAFAQAFVPVFARTLQTDGQAAAEKAASQALAFIMAIVVAFSILLEIAMPLLMPVILYTYADRPEIMTTAILMTQLTTPYLACMTLASLLSGVLNTKERFALSSAAPILLNVVTLVPLLLVQDRQQAAYAATAAVTVAGILQGALLWWGVKRMGIRIRSAFLRLPRRSRKSWRWRCLARLPAARCRSTVRSPTFSREPAREHLASFTMPSGFTSFRSDSSAWRLEWRLCRGCLGTLPTPTMSRRTGRWTMASRCPWHSPCRRRLPC